MKSIKKEKEVKIFLSKKKVKAYLKENNKKYLKNSIHNNSK